MAHDDDIFFSIKDMTARLDPASETYQPYGSSYFHWLLAQAARYAHAGAILKVETESFATVLGAEQAAANILNAKFDCVNNRQDKMYIEAFFDQTLFGDAAWQTTNGITHPNVFEIIVDFEV